MLEPKELAGACADDGLVDAGSEQVLAPVPVHVPPDAHVVEEAVLIGRQLKALGLRGKGLVDQVHASSVLACATCVFMCLRGRDAK